MRSDGKPGPSSVTSTITVSASQRVAKAASTLKVRPAAAKIRVTQRGRLVVNVAGPVAAQGQVLVRSRGKVVASGTVRRGKVSVRLPRLKAGKHRLVVQYLGSDQVAPSSSKVTLKVVKRRR